MSGVIFIRQASCELVLGKKDHNPISHDSALEGVYQLKRGLRSKGGIHGTDGAALIQSHEISDAPVPIPYK